MSRVLVCFFSAGGEDIVAGETKQVGNTATMAQAIVEKLKEDGHEVTSFQIQPKVPYPDSYDQKLVKATEERAMQERPEYAEDVPGFDDYDVVFIGYPVWCSDLPMIMYTVLESHVFTGKIVIPFCTHGGSGEVDTFRIVGEKAVGSAPEQGLALQGDIASKPGGQKQVGYWIDQLGI